MARILIIEDKPNQRALYSEELADEGYEVLCAADGPEALEMFKRQRPDLIVTDILLPGMTGIEIMERLLATDPDIPVIIHSAYSSPSRDFMAGLARAYVVKSGGRWTSSLSRRWCTFIWTDRALLKSAREAGKNLLPCYLI